MKTEGLSPPPPVAPTKIVRNVESDKMIQSNNYHSGDT
jgi:hypothetical protein